MNDIWITSNHTGPTVAIEIDADLCIGCNSCANICRIQTILPHPEQGHPPVIAYPDECWYCGCCVEACPTGALQMRLPINQRIMFKDKESGEVFRIGTKDAPDKTFFKAPFGWIDHPEFGKIMQRLEREEAIAITLPAEFSLKIGKFFGEKEEKDNTERLTRFLQLIGFTDVQTGNKSSDDTAACKIEDIRSKEALQTPIDNGNQKARVEWTCADGSTESRLLSVMDISDLLHRLCVSNYSAVKVWRDLG